VQIGEIAAAAAGDQNLLSNSIRAFKQQNATPSLPSFNGAHQASSAGSEDDDVVFMFHAARVLST
jgi:hypothetical protein